MTELFTAPQVARLLGVTATTVKRWEASGLIESSLTPGGHHRFKRGEVDRFLRAQEARSDDIESRLVELLLTGDDSFELQGTLMEMRGRLGSWFHVADEVGNALTVLGRQWEMGIRTVADEHIATRRLQHALWVCTSSLPSPPKQPVCLLATVEGEQHTLGLSLAKLCLREAGWNTLWLGSPTPTTVLVNAIEQYRPQMVAVSASAYCHDPDEMAEHYRVVAKACRECGAEIMLGGEGAWPDGISAANRVRTFAEFAELIGRRK
jgi:excisionase family DNA binding protein